MSDEGRQDENLRILMDRSLHKETVSAARRRTPVWAFAGLLLLVVGVLAGSIWAVRSLAPTLTFAALFGRPGAEAPPQPAPLSEPDLGPVAQSLDLPDDTALAAKVILTEPDQRGLRTLAVLRRTADGWTIPATRGITARGEPVLRLEDLPGQPKAIVVADPPHLQAFARADLKELDYARLTAPTGVVGNRIVVDKGKNVLYLYLGGHLSRVFAVATGADRTGPAALDNEFTPVGTFVINTKVADPDWMSPDGERWIAGGDPENPLGTRWLGFAVYDWDGGNIWGIHGTFEPETVGHWVTNGCIRLTNADIEELFEVVEPGMIVEVIDSYPAAVGGQPEAELPPDSDG